MSKFNNNVISGNGNIIGDGGVINNTTVNNTAINNNYRNSNNQNNSNEVFGLGIGLIFGLGAIGWWFFKNVEKIYDYLIIGTAITTVITIVALIILLISREAVLKDVTRAFITIVYCISLLGLSVVAEDFVSNELITLSHKSDVFYFWKSLTEHGQRLALINISIACLILMANIIIFIVSFRQFSYSLSSVDRRGFWYNLYWFLRIFQVKYASFIVLPIIGTIFFLLGKLKLFW